MLPHDLTVSSDVTFASDYVFRGIRFAEESFQPTVEGAVGNFYAGIWANLPISADRGDHELNYYGGVEFDVPGVDFAAFDFGLTVYHFPASGDNRDHEFFLGANFELPQMPEIGASLYYFYDIDSDIQTLEAAVGYSIALEDMGVPASFDISVFGGAVGGSSRDGEAYNYYGVSGELPFALTEASAITAGVHYATAEGINFAGIERGKNLFWTLGYSTSF